MDESPYFPFIVRECADALPTVMARYDFGVERRISIENMETADIEMIVEELVN